MDQQFFLNPTTIGMIVGIFGYHLLFKDGFSIAAFLETALIALITLAAIHFIWKIK